MLISVIGLADLQKTIGNTDRNEVSVRSMSHSERKSKSPMMLS